MFVIVVMVMVMVMVMVIMSFLDFMAAARGVLMLVLFGFCRMTAARGVLMLVLFGFCRMAAVCRVLMFYVLFSGMEMGGIIFHIGLFTQSDDLCFIQYDQSQCRGDDCYKNCDDYLEYILFVHFFISFYFKLCSRYGEMMRGKRENFFSREKKFSLSPRALLTLSRKAKNFFIYFHQPLSGTEPYFIMFQ